jgi:hypothetical protein
MGYWWRSQKEGNLDAILRIILKLILGRMEWYGLGSSGSGRGQ